MSILPVYSRGAAEREKAGAEPGWRFSPVATAAIIIPLVVMLLLGAGGCRGEREGEVLFDFETEAELDRIGWKCRTLFSLSEDYASSGRRSLKMTFYPSVYPGFTPLIFNRDWQGYDSLRLDIFNPENRAMHLTLRMDDREDAVRYADRFQRRIEVLPGENRVVIPAAEIRTSGGARKMNLAFVEKVVLFMMDPPSPVVLYLDHIRLCRAR